MAASRALRQDSWLVTMIAVILVVAVLWAASIVLIPIALAVLLTFLLAPLCDRLERLHFGRVLSVIVVSGLMLVVIGFIGWILAGQFLDLAEQIPRYQANIRKKIESLPLPAGGPIARATRSLQELGQDILSQATPQAYPYFPENPPQQPIPVRIVEEPRPPVEAIVSLLRPLAAPLASAGIVIIFVFFMLLQRKDLRDRVYRLVGRGRLTVATEAIDDAARRVSRFLLALSTVNVLYGVAIGTGLYFIGLPNAALWGAIAATLRYIPYVGTWLGAVMPILLGMAVFDTWLPVFETVGLFVVIELITAYVLEPIFYGARTGLSPTAILAAAVFWAWLWGPVGLVLATPLTVCVVVLGRYVPSLEFLSVLLSDQPSLPISARLYQRLLALDQDEAYELCETYLTEHSLLDLYEEVLLPALAMAERDRHHGRIEPEREEAVFTGMRDMVEDFGDRYRAALRATAAEAPPSPMATPMPGAGAQPLTHVGPPVMCIAARDLADEIAAEMVSQLLMAIGIACEVIPPDNLDRETQTHLAQVSPRAVCISALPPQAAVRARHLCRKLKIDVPVVVGFWTASDIESLRNRAAPCDPQRVVATLAEAVDLLKA